ncbi:hypothetical protein HYH03_011434 [Edaphochlamys debaryana]|uniref:ADP,ATP carrier protein n=1 Tax=Edaphochlamys debaryana TaxID=47281 RepID=A0A835XTT4_9CHLO|nr:hypothetical protein HYH03_011434 [Edaphochlamys debaryana]|eukprot:KAG2490128.1 hypothetical protein HYH03_011434 [Edaphochlamys debaryana]
MSIPPVARVSRPQPIRTSSPALPLLPSQRPRPAVLCRSGAGPNGSGAQQPEQPAPTPNPAPATAATVAIDKPVFLGLTLLTWQKAIALGLMFFAILFNYTILRNTKDVLVVTAPGSGAEAIPFLKTLDLPIAVLFTVTYTALANRLSNDALFYACLLPFIGFFGFFGFAIYPNKDWLHPTTFCNKIAPILGDRWSAPLALLQSWTYSAFYLVAEMWGSVVVSLLFWGLANQIMTVDEAATFYPLFGMGANLSLIVAGNMTHRLSAMRASLPPGVDGWGVALQCLMGAVVLNGVVIAGLHWALQKWVLPRVQEQRVALAAAGKGAAIKPKKPKTKMSMGESFKFLASSPYIRDLATMVVSFAVALQLVEVTWKSKLKTAYPSPADYSAFMGRFSEVVGMVTLGMMLVGRFVIKRFGWGVGAMATPAVILSTSIIFLGLVLAEGPLTAPLAVLGTTPLMAAVLVGSLQNVFSRSAKYSLFDPCKEMAYIPLDDEVKSKGKAAVDVVGNLLGKSGGAVVQQAAIFTFGSLAASTPYLGIILTILIVNWMRSVLSLEKQFHALMGQQKEEQEAHAQAHADAQEAAEGANGNGSHVSNGSSNGAAAAAAPAVASGEGQPPAAPSPAPAAA